MTQALAETFPQASRYYHDARGPHNGHSRLSRPSASCYSHTDFRICERGALSRARQWVRTIRLAEAMKVIGPTAPA